MNIKTKPKPIFKLDTGSFDEYQVKNIPITIAGMRKGNRTAHLTSLKYLKKKNPTPTVPANWQMVTAVANGNSRTKKNIANIGKPKPIVAWSIAPTTHIIISAK
jgi:hypothetical protein